MTNLSPAISSTSRQIGDEEAMELNEHYEAPVTADELAEQLDAIADDFEWAARNDKPGTPGDYDSARTCRDAASVIRKLLKARRDALREIAGGPSEAERILQQIKEKRQ